jgi:hypothetical protein
MHATIRFRRAQVQLRPVPLQVQESRPLRGGCLGTWCVYGVEAMDGRVGSDREPVPQSLQPAAQRQSRADGTYPPTTKVTSAPFTALPASSSTRPTTLVSPGTIDASSASKSSAGAGVSTGSRWVAEISTGGGATLGAMTGRVGVGPAPPPEGPWRSKKAIHSRPPATPPTTNARSSFLGTGYTSAMATSGASL